MPARNLAEHPPSTAETSKETIMQRSWVWVVALGTSLVAFNPIHVIDAAPWLPGAQNGGGAKTEYSALPVEVAEAPHPGDGGGALHRGGVGPRILAPGGAGSRFAAPRFHTGPGVVTPRILSPYGHGAL